MSERPLVVALLVANADPAIVTRGSDQRPCDGCGRAVWLAPSSVRLGDIEVNCAPCAARRTDITDATAIELAPGALDELRAATDEWPE